MIWHLVFLLTLNCHSETLPKTLSETGLYLDILSKNLNSQITPFSPQYPLWSDTAEKTRWVFLPEGKQIQTQNPDRWVFPAGTKFWKEFVFGGKRVETRFFVKISEGEGFAHWRFATYVWNEEETEAVQANPYGMKEAFPIPGTQVSHSIPSKAQCVTCHMRGGDPILGFENLQLSDDRDPLSPHQQEKNGWTLSLLKHSHKLTHPLEVTPRVISNSASGRAAMGYLHGNCGHCHNPSGFAKKSQLFTRYQSNVDEEKESPAFRTLVNQFTRQHHVPGKIPGKNSFRIEAGDPENSGVIQLMNHREVGHPQMPPLATQLVDQEGVELLKTWISVLE